MTAYFRILPLSAALIAGIFCAGVAMAQESYVNLQFRYMNDMLSENIVVGVGDYDDSKIIAFLQPTDPKVLNMTRTDPFTGQEIYKHSIVVCNFEFYWGNLSDQRVVLKSNDQEFTPNVATFILEMENGETMSMNTWTGGLLEAKRIEGGRTVFDGNSGVTEPSSSNPKFASEAEAYEARYSVCDISKVRHIRIQSFENFRFERDGQVSPVDVTYVVLFDSSPFIESRKAENEGRERADEAEALDRIINMKGSSLDLSDLTELRRVPREVLIFIGLEVVDLGELQIEDLSPLAHIPSLKAIRVGLGSADLSPLLDLPNLQMIGRSSKDKRDFSIFDGTGVDVVTFE